MDDNVRVVQELILVGLHYGVSEDLFVDCLWEGLFSPAIGCRGRNASRGTPAAALSGAPDVSAIEGHHTGLGPGPEAGGRHPDRRNRQNLSRTFHFACQVLGDVAVGGPAEFWQDRSRAVASDLSVTFWMPNSQTQFAALTKTKQWAYNPAMALKHAALFALIGMTLLTVLLAAGFIRDFSAFLSGAVAAMALLKSGIHLLASLSVAVFLYVFHKAQF